MHAGIGELQDCTDLLTRSDEREVFWREHGYLFLRGVIDKLLAENLRGQIVAEMKRQGAVAESARADNFTLTSQDTVNQAGLYDNVAYNTFWRSCTSLFETLLGGVEIYLFRNTVMRFAVPGEAVYVTPPHQDGASVPGTFRTVWVPLMDVPVELGGLVVADGSHQGGLRSVVNDTAHMSYTAKLPFGHIPAESISEPWLSAHYRLGDAVILDSLTIHRALPNRSDHVRLSVDTRFSPADAPHDFVTHSYVGCDFVKHRDRYIAEMPSAVRNAP